MPQGAWKIITLSSPHFLTTGWWNRYGALLVFRFAEEEQPVFVIEGCEQDLVDRPLSEPRGLMHVRDDLTTQEHIGCRDAYAGFCAISPSSEDGAKNGLKRSAI